MSELTWIPDKDSELRAENADANYSSETDIGIYRWDGFGPIDTRRGVVQFDFISDLSEFIATGSQINSAKMRLFVTGDNDGYGYITYVLRKDWAEGTVTWNTPWTAGGASSLTEDIDISRSSNVGISTVDAYIEIDVTDDIKDWFNDDIPNYGWRISSIDIESTTKPFSSKENISSQRPELVIDYTAVPPSAFSPSAGMIFSDSVQVSGGAFNDSISDGIVFTDSAVLSAASEQYNESRSDAFELSDSGIGEHFVDIPGGVAVSAATWGLNSIDTYTGSFEDALVYSVSPDQNYGSDGALQVQGGIDSMIKADFESDLSTLGVSAGNIVSAGLYIMQHDAAQTGSLVASAGRATSTWTEGTVTWNNAPNVTAPESTQTWSNEKTVYKHFNVTDTIIGIMNGTYDNFGWRLRSVTGVLNLYRSSEYGTDLTLPYLKIDWETGSSGSANVSGSDGFELTDTSSFTWSADVSGSDSFTLDASAASTSLSPSAYPVDGIVFSDSLGVTGSHASSASDIITWSDRASGAFTMPNAISDGLTFSEAASSLDFTSDINITDGIKFSEIVDEEHVIDISTTTQTWGLNTTDDYSTGNDTLVFEPNPDDNYATNAYLQASNNVATPNARSFMIYDFESDLSALGVSAVTDAKLWIQDSPVSFGDDVRTVEFYRTTSSWTDTTTTWNNQPSFSGQVASKVFTESTDADVYRSVDLTDFINEILDGTYTNYGITLVLDTLNESSAFIPNSLETSDGNRPYLELTWGGTADISVSDTFTLSTSAYAQGFIANVSGSDGFTFSESASSTGSLANAAADVLDFSDTASQIGSIGSSAFDTLVLTDSIIYSPQSASASDIIDMSDSSYVLGSMQSSASDGMVWSESASGIFEMFRDAADGIELSDIGTFTQSVSAVAFDGIVFEEAIIRDTITYDTIQDGVTFGDAIAEFVSFDYHVEDIVVFTDPVTGVFTGSLKTFNGKKITFTFVSNKV